MSKIKRSKRKGKVYLSEIETKRVNGKVVTRHIRYIGKGADSKPKFHLNFILYETEHQR